MGSVPAQSAGFETETEFTIHALELGEMPATYRDRPAGSASKLRTYADGLRILRTILLLVRRRGRCGSSRSRRSACCCSGSV